MRHLLLFICLIFTFGLYGQIYNPVKWTIELNHKAKQDYILVAKATIADDWWVYSQHIADGGPTPTTLNYDQGSHFKLAGKNKESNNAKKGFDKLFEMDVTKFEHYFTIEQKIKISDPSKPIKGYVNFQTCNSDRCLPPTDVEFELFAKPSSGDADIKKTDSKIVDNTTVDKKTKVVATPPVEKKKKVEEKPKITVTPTPSSKKDTSYQFPVSPGEKGIVHPVKWTFRSEKKSENVYEIIAEATIENGWHIYAPGIAPEIGPLPTSFVLDQNDGYTVEGELNYTSTGRSEALDKFFDIVVVKYKHDAHLSRMIKTTNASIISGSVEFMACDESRCLLPEFIEFKIDLKSGLEFIDNTLMRPTVDDKGVIDQTIPIIQNTYDNPLSNCGEAKQKKSNLLWMFIFGFGGGLLALLTPCVFPMIPLTVSFFTKDTKRKGWQNGLWYGASIILIYVALGILLTIIFGATALNDLSTNAIANTLFFIIFVFFAFSFFGYYEITLPSSWSNKSDALADKGGLLGIFFMAATLAIVSFSCTGPLIGSALVEASSEGTLGPAIVMAGFSLALAIPFGLFAIFPSWLNSLPKSGGWMNSVKVMLGFLELALALKFLSVADMASHWGILRYEIFMGFWVIIAIAMGIYMFGIIRFPHDSAKKRLAPISALVGVFFILLGLYLATGFFRSEKTGTYNALSLMSGLAPPAHYNYLVPVKNLDANLKAQYASLTKCANNFDCFHDYYEGIAYAKQNNKPVLLDFTGYGCVNCRKTEEHIWVKEEVRRKISEDYVLVSLYVDDKEPLDSIIYSAVQQKKIRSIGGIWGDFQIANFKQNSQPLYVLMTPDQQVLTAPRGYDPDADAYNQFLE
ncbi:MAG TPA: protein-disulfide reductase DsbD domain-containing protein, partial [Saprospiraceae bacterium]|nr:protein-disulfide reductase DsbD domain-containing protein [Saprospiraceae bacterium]